MTIGEKLRAARGEKSMEEVCAAVGITKAALTAYETDSRTPRDEVKILLSDYYNFDISDLFFKYEIYPHEELDREYLPMQDFIRVRLFNGELTHTETMIVYRVLKHPELFDQITALIEQAEAKE